MDHMPVRYLAALREVSGAQRAAHAAAAAALPSPQRPPAGAPQGAGAVGSDAVCARMRASCITEEDVG